jgi:YD repeat-containing protein
MRAIRLLYFCLCALSLGAAPVSIIPSAAPRGARVLITGSGLDAPDLAAAFTDASGNPVAARILATAPAYAEVAVPAAAVSGPVRVTAGGSTTPLPFTVAPDPTFATVTTLALSTKANDNFKALGGVALMPNGTALIADTAHNVVQLVAPGAAPVVIAGQWAKSGYADGAAAQALFKSPAGMAYDPVANIIYVADTGNNVIRRIAADGTVSTLAGNGQAGSLDGTGAAAQFKAPQAIALDAQGNIYVADTGNSEIRRITPSGAVTTIAGTPRAGFADGSAAQALFSAPAGIAVDRDGNIYVADGGNNRIRKVSNGVVATIAGNAQQGLVDGFATLAQFKAPGGMAVDAAGNVYVSDTGNAVIRLIANGSVTTIAGDPKQQGYLDGTASAAQFKAPAGLAVAGGIFIADSGNDALRLIVPELRFSAVYPPNGPEAGGNTIRLLGTGFILGQTNVAIAATRVDTALVSSTELLITMPPGTGQTSITVATAAGSITLPNCYTYLPPPTVTAVQPAKGRTAGGDTVTISGTNFGTASDTTVTFGSASATISAITATTITVLTPPNTAGTVDVTVTTAVGSAKRTGGFTYLDPPAITLVTPSRGKLAGGDGISISGSNFDDATTTVKVGGKPATNVIVVSPALVRATTPAGAAGAATVTVSTAGGTASLTGGFIYVPPPAIASFNPASGAAGSVVTITGQNFEPAATNDAVTIGGVLATVTSASTTQLIATVPLNAITGRITVTTAGGTAISATDFIVATFRSLTVTAPTTSLQPGTQQQFNAIATLLDNTTRDVTSSAVWTSSNPSVATVSAGGVVHALAAGSADVSASYAGYNATAHVSVQATLTLPPATLQGPPIDQTIAVPLADSLRFLYTGVNAPQTGVAQNAIDDTRVAVISGRVMDRAGLALGGVAITVAGHSEYGQTTTRGDGRYDVAFNGGGALHLVFTKPGFIAADRIVTTTWNQQKPLEDIALVQYDSAVTAVTTGAAVNQIAQGSSVTDADGTRRATVLIPAGVTATVTDANGIQQQVSTLHLRATEFTAGATGRQAMPAALPPASGYTYCVELSVDEGASVSFSKPLPVYVDNFINFPVGTAVPVGYFDRSTQQWVPSPNGVVLKILSISNGVAAIDSTGTGQPDSSTRLAALAVDSAELAQLGSTYVTGKTLWRFRVAHFSPWDSNFPYGPPSDAAFPPATAPDQPMWIPGCEHECGSVIEVENQTLGESVPVAGTPYGLHYNSGLHDRTKYRATVHVTGASIPASLSAVSVTVSIAGRYSTQNLTPSPNVDVVIDWDGRDAYGRPVQGTRVAEVTVAYKYAAQYRSPGTVDPAFAQPPARATIIGDRARAELSYAQNWKIALGNTAPDTGFGDWTFGAQRSYDPVSRLLVEGDGSIHAPDMTHTGEAALYNAGPGVHAIAPAPDGGYYYVDSRCTVVRVDARGLSSTVAGVPGSCGYTTPDGVPPLTPIAPYGPIAVGPDGAVYFADQAQITMPWGPVGVRIVRRLGGGRMDVVAGGGTGGDGGPAKLARIVEISALTVAADGSLFIADPKTFNPVAVGGDCNCIHRVGTDGMMTMYAGLILGVANLPPAFQLYFGDYLSSLTGLAAAPDGSLYWSTRQRIGRITPDGNVQPVTSPGLAPHDGDAAIAASPGADGGIALAPDGSLIIGDPGFGRVWVITGGVIHVLGGTGVTSNATIADGTLAKAAALGAGGVAVTPDGSVLMSSASRVYRTQPVFPPLRPGAPAVIPAADGVAGYIFENVRHSRTVNTLTGTTLERLSYDSHGYLVSVTDVDNQTTTIERDSTGKPTAIIAPGGQRTSLTLDAQGRLQSVTDPSNAAWQFSYNNLGLLSQLTDPRQGLHKFTYDDLGRLTKDENPAGGFIALGRSGSSTLFSVLRNTAEGRTSSTAFQQGSWMQTTRPITGKDGLITARAENGDGSRTETTPSGVIIQRTMSPDSRFSMAAAFESFSSAQMPSGLKRSVTSSRQVTLSDPNDLLSVTSMTASMTVNGRSFSSTFNKATRVLTSTSATGRTQSVSYDANDHPVSQQIPGLATVQLGYESHGLVTSVVSGARQTSMTYDDHFRVKTITDPLHRTVSFEYDAADR